MTLSEPDVETNPDACWRQLCDAVPAHSRIALEHAYQLAARAHVGQFRESAADSPRVPYIVHPLRVALVLANEWNMMKVQMLSAALMHDVIEDCPREYVSAYECEIKDIFGEAVFDAVCVLTKPTLAPTDVKDAHDARYFSELRRAAGWVRAIKCADRVDNLRDALVWRDPKLWSRCSSDTIGWHLFLARETAPIAEAALFKALIDGERALNGRVPIWADGHLIDPRAAALIPEHIARDYQIIGLALQGSSLYIGIGNIANSGAIQAAQSVTKCNIVPIGLSEEAIHDALTARLYGEVTTL